jgi:hypothetical protein
MTIHPLILFLFLVNNPSFLRVQLNQYSLFGAYSALQRLPIRVVSADRPRAGRLPPLSRTYVRFILINQHAYTQDGSLCGDQAVALAWLLHFCHFLFPFYVYRLWVWTFGCSRVPSCISRLLTSCALLFYSPFQLIFRFFFLVNSSLPPN